MTYQPKIIKPPPELDDEEEFVPPSQEKLKELTATKFRPSGSITRSDSPLTLPSVITNKPPLQPLQPQKPVITTSIPQPQPQQPKQPLIEDSKSASKNVSQQKLATVNELQPPPNNTRFGLFLITLLAIAGNFFALKLTALVGMGLFWSSLVASGLVVLFYAQRKRDVETAKWQASFDLLKSRASRVLSSNNETAEWLNTILRSAWSATLPSLQPRIVEALNNALTSTPLSLPLKSIRCIDVDLSDAVPTVVQVSSIFADNIAGQFPKSRFSNQQSSLPPNQHPDLIVNKAPPTITSSPFGGTTTTTNQTMLVMDNQTCQNNMSWLSIFGGSRNRLGFLPVVRQLHPPSIALDADVIVDTLTSQAWLTAKMAYLPVEITAVLHSIRIQASVRIFAEFNHTLAFPHISRLSVTFLEPPEFNFELRTLQQLNLAQLPFISATLRAHVAKFLMRNAMYPDWVDIFSNQISTISPLQHHIQHPSRHFDDISMLISDVEPFRAAVGVLIVDARLIPRIQTQQQNQQQIMQNYGSNQYMPIQQQHQPIPGDFWLIFQLAGRRRYEQINVVRNGIQICTGKFAFLVTNADAENLRIEAWSKRGSLPVKVRQILVRSMELFKIPNIASTSPFSGPNRVELPLPQWDSSIHLVTTYVHLTAVPLLSLMPGSSTDFDQQKMAEQDAILGGDRANSAFTTIYQRRRLSKQVSGMIRSETPETTVQTSNLGQRTSSVSGQIILGGVLFVRLRNLNIRPLVNNQQPNNNQHQRFIYAVVTLNGELLACSTQHPRGNGENITTAVLHELEVIIPTPKNQQQENNVDLEFSVDVMLNDGPIKALHTLLGSTSFSYKLPSQKVDSTNQGVSLNANSKSMQLLISRSHRRIKNQEINNGEQTTKGGNEAGQIFVDLYFRPVSGLEDINPTIKILPSEPANSGRLMQRQASATQDNMLDSQSLQSTNDFFEVTLIGATDLRLPNPNSLGDLFAKVKLNDRLIYSTRVKPSTLEPNWSEKLRLPSLTEWDRVLIEIWDHDFVSKSNYVGHVTLGGDQVLANSIPAAVLVQLQQQSRMMSQQQQQQQQQPPPPNSFEPITPASQQQNQQQQNQWSIWLPLAESNGQIELLIVSLQPPQLMLQQQRQQEQALLMNQQQQQQQQNNPALRRYTGSQSSVSYFRPSPMSPLMNDLHLNSPFGGAEMTPFEDSSRRNTFNRAATCLSPVLHRQAAVTFGSSEGLTAYTGVPSDTRPSSAAPAYQSFSLENLNNPPQTAMNTAANASILMSNQQQQQQQQQQMSMSLIQSQQQIYDNDNNYVMSEQQNKLPLLESALLASSSSSNIRVSLIVCLLEVRGNLSALLRSSAGRGVLDRYAQSQHYISLKISKKASAKTLQVFSTTLAKSRPLPVQEPPLEANVVPTVVSNISFQLLDMRLDGVVKIVVTPLEITSAAAANVSSTSRPMTSSPVQSPTPPDPPIIITPTQLANAKPVSPVIDWTCDVRELLAGGTQEFDPVMMQQQQQQQQSGGRSLPNAGVSRRVRFFVCPPDITFVFRVTQIFRPQQMNAKPSSSSVSAAVNARRYGSLRSALQRPGPQQPLQLQPQQFSPQPPPQTVVIPPNQPLM